MPASKQTRSASGRDSPTGSLLNGQERQCAMKGLYGGGESPPREPRQQNAMNQLAKARGAGQGRGGWGMT